MVALAQILWPTREILTSFLIVIAYNFVISTAMSIYQRVKSKDVLKHHALCLKAHQMLDDELEDEKKIVILKQYIRLQEEKILLNGHSLADISKNPALAMGKRDFIPMVVKFLSFRVLSQFFKERSPVAMHLPFDARPPFTMILHWGSRDELRNNDVTYQAVNLILGRIIGTIIGKIVLGKRASIGMARRMEIQQLRMAPNQEFSQIKITGYEHLKDEFPDIEEAQDFDDKTD